MGVKRRILGVAATGAMLLTALPSVSFAASSKNISVPQGVGQGVLQQASYNGNIPGNTSVSIDIVMKLRNQDQLQQYITDTTTPGNPNFRHYLSVSDFVQNYAPIDSDIQSMVAYLQKFGINASVYPNNMIIRAQGSAAQLQKAFNVDLQNAKLGGKSFHATKVNPQMPDYLAQNVLCILGLTNYSAFTSHAIKNPDVKTSTTPPTGPYALYPSDLEQHYNATPLVDAGAAGQGQTMGIVTLAGFNPQDAYDYWKILGLKVNPNRITVTNVDKADTQPPSAYYAGYDETTLDVEQSGALAPDANINVYVGPNTDAGFVDAYANAITDNQVQSLSVSWGESEQIINVFVDAQLETPQYANVFNQLYMEAAAQGISNFAASGDGGAYDSAVYYGSGFAGLPGLFNRTVDNPADSPYITAAGGTTLPWQNSTRGINVTKERAWGWDYYYNHLDTEQPANMTNMQWWSYIYFVGGGGGFSDFFPTPSYQQGVTGINTYAGVNNWLPSADGSSVTRNTANAQVVTGTSSGRNLPDLSMNADPETGYAVYLSATNGSGTPDKAQGWAQYGGTSFVSPQLNGLTALINSADHTQIGFWNPQIYHFAMEKSSPFTPLNSQGPNNDNIFYTGQPGTVYNQATGLGIPDITALAQDFAATTGGVNGSTSGGGHGNSKK